MNLKEILQKNLKIPVEESLFIKSPPFPYVVFIQYENIRGVSSENNVLEKNIRIELYNSKYDQLLENQVIDCIIEEILKIDVNSDFFEIIKNRDYIESEQMFMTTFDFDLVEKRRN